MLISLYNTASHLSTNHMSPFCPIMFPGWKTAKKFACARTKTSSVLNETIMPSLKNYLVDQLSKDPYTFVNGVSSDTDVKKLNAVCAKEMDFRLCNKCSTSGESCSTAETVFESSNQQLIKYDISWQQRASVRLDITNANTGTKCQITLAVKL